MDTQTQVPARASTAVVGGVTYTASDSAETDLFFYDAPPGTIGNPPVPEPHDMSVEDARGQDLSLDRDGFYLFDCPIPPPVFGIDDGVREAYYPAVEQLVAQAVGARQVKAFDHNFRSTRVDAEMNSYTVRQAAARAHADYTEVSGPQRMRELMPADEVDGLLSRRFAFINLWRPVTHVVEESPLALCDARSVKPDDYILNYNHYADRIGEIYMLRHNPDHRWLYFPNMTPGEAILIKCYDSETDGRTRFAPHCAIKDPRISDQTPRRESIEVRTVAFFD